LEGQNLADEQDISDDGDFVVVNKFVEAGKEEEKILTDSGIEDRRDSLDQFESEVVLGNRSALDIDAQSSEKGTSSQSSESSNDSDESDSDSSKSNEEVNKESDSEDLSSDDSRNEESVGKNADSAKNSNPNVCLENQSSSTNGGLNGTVNESSIGADSEERILNSTAKPAENKINNESIEEANHSDIDEQKKPLNESSENLSQLNRDSTITSSNSKKESPTLVSTESVGGP